MKRFTLKALCLLSGAALALSLTGCGGGSASSAASSTASSSVAAVASFGPASDFDYANFDYSQGITDAGLWEAVTATDYVTLPENYASLSIAAEDVTPSDDDVQAQLDSVLSSYATDDQVTDRAAADGDSVNIDYSGTVGGVAFTGGTAQGYDLTLGSSTFIEGFEGQIVGHTPGDTFDVTVTFPSSYRDSTDAAGNALVLADQEAVFAVTLNYISESVTPELTDDWVSATYGESQGITTVSAFKEAVSQQLYTSNLNDQILDTLLATSTFKDPVPYVILNYTVCEFLSYYSRWADSYSTDMDTFVQQIGYDTLDAMLADSESDIMSRCHEALIYQAIAEQQGLAVDDATMETYASYVDSLGSKYVTMYALNQLALQSVAGSAQVA